jgi:hypothetical protein
MFSRTSCDDNELETTVCWRAEPHKCLRKYGERGSGPASLSLDGRFELREDAASGPPGP